MIYMGHSTVKCSAQKIDLAEIDVGGPFGNTKMGWKGIFCFWPIFPTEGEKLGFQNWKFLKLQIALAPSFFYAERRLIRQIKATNEPFHIEQKKVQNCQSWQPCFEKC